MLCRRYSADYFRREPCPYKYGGVYYPSSEETAKFYPKFYECKHPAAEGFLRHESTLRGNYHIGELCGKLHPTIQDIIDPSFTKKILEKDLERLRMKEQTVCTRDVAMEILIGKYGASRASNLIGYLELRKCYTRDQLISKHLLTPQQISYRERHIALAGVAIQQSEKVLLPPLSIDLEQ